MILYSTLFVGQEGCLRSSRTEHAASRENYMMALWWLAVD